MMAKVKRRERTVMTTTRIHEKARMDNDTRIYIFVVFALVFVFRADFRF